MIKKIVNIKNLGIFKDYTSNQLPDFGRYNLIYGWNASGKTTLSKLFEALKTGTHEDFPNLKYKLKASNRKEDISEIHPYEKVIKVFNKEYISKNIKIEEGEARTIIILGEKNEKISKKIKKDEERLKSLQEQLNASEKLHRETSTAQGKRFTDIAKVIGQTWNTIASRDYKKTQAEKKFRALFANKGVTDEILDDTTKANHSSTCTQSSKNKLQKVSLPSILMNGVGIPFELSLRTCLEESRTLCSQIIDVVVLERLRENNDISRWVEEGLLLHKKHESEKCEFCAQKVPDERFKELGELFNESDKEIKKNIDSTLQIIKGIHAGIKDLKLEDIARLYTEFEKDYGAAENVFEEKRANFLKAIEELESALKDKKEKINEAVEIGSNVDLSDILSSLEKINSLINQHNEKTENFEKIKKTAAEKIENHFLAEIYHDITEQDASLQEMSSDIKHKEKESQYLEEKIISNKAKISPKHKACEELNQKLKTFLGRNEIFFEVRSNEDGYLLKRCEGNTKNLSEGEKTAVGLVYFLVSLGEDGNKLTNSIVFIDDPVSSLDSNSISQAFAFIKNETKDAEQIFISTHNYDFFKKTKSWFDEMKSKDEKEDSTNKKTEFFMIKNHMANEVRSSSISILDDLIKKYNSEYQYLFSVIVEESERQDQSGLKEWYPLPNMARKFLEIFLAFKVPSKRIFSDQLDSLFKENSTLEPNKKIKLKSFLNEKSHYFPNGLEGFSLESFPEYKEILKDIISLIKEADEKHYNELFKCISRKPVAQEKN